MQRTSVVDSLPVYIFDEINRLKHEARLHGRDVIDLGMGNPDLPTPPLIVEKLRQAVLDPKNHRYSVSRGIAGLRRELACWYRRKHRVELDPQRQVIAFIDDQAVIRRILEHLHLWDLPARPPPVLLWGRKMDDLLPDTDPEPEPESGFPSDSVFHDDVPPYAD